MMVVVMVVMEGGRGYVTGGDGKYYDDTRRTDRCCR
jgi:hypothetical protein